MSELLGLHEIDDCPCPGNMVYEGADLLVGLGMNAWGSLGGLVPATAVGAAGKMIDHGCDR